MSSLSVVSQVTNEQKEFLEDLNSYYIESRYTEHLERLFKHLSKEIAMSILSQAEEFFLWLKDMLQKIKK